MPKAKTKPKAKAFQTRTTSPKISAGMRRYWQDRRKRESATAAYVKANAPTPIPAVEALHNRLISDTRKINALHSRAQATRQIKTIVADLKAITARLAKIGRQS